ncbi:MAG: serine acetyltransferase, partial [Thermoguttaceae bacterium]|nr:serine acetyltransferase [Thermoguttaceae bacterium]
MGEIRLANAETRTRDVLPELTENIVASYSRTRATCRLDRCSLPSKETVVEILSDLNEVLFPGFRRRDRLNSNNVVYYVGNLVDKIYDALRAQISRAFCGETANGSALEPCRPEKRADFDRLGDEKAAAFLAKIPEIREKLEKDVEAAIKGDPACKSTAEVVFCYPGFEAITTHRIARALWELDVPLLPRIMSELAHSRTGVDIHPGAKIG